MVNSFEFEVGSTLGLSLCADKVEVFVPTHSEIQGKVAPELPIVLKVKTEHLGPARQIEIRITGGRGHAADCTWCRKPVRILNMVRQDDAGLVVEIDFERRIEFKESTKFPFPHIIHARPKGVVASANREIVLELILRLVGLLRHVCVRAKADVGRKCKQRNFAVSINQVVPVLITDCSGINHGATECRIKS